MQGSKRTTSSPVIERKREELAQAKIELEEVNAVQPQAEEDERTARETLATINAQERDLNDEWRARRVEAMGACDRAIDRLAKIRARRRDLECAVAMLKEDLAASDLERTFREEHAAIAEKLPETLAERGQLIEVLATLDRSIEDRRAKQAEKSHADAAALLAAHRRGEVLAPAASAPENPEVGRFVAMRDVAAEQIRTLGEMIAALQKRAPEVHALWRQARLRVAMLAFEDAKATIAPAACELLAAQRMAGVSERGKVEIVPSAGDVDAALSALANECPELAIVALERPTVDDPAHDVDGDDQTPAEEQASA